MAVNSQLQGDPSEDQYPVTGSEKGISSTSLWPSKSETLNCGFEVNLTRSCLSSEGLQSGLEPKRDSYSSYPGGDHVNVCSKIGYVGPDDHRNPKKSDFPTKDSIDPSQAPGVLKGI